MKVWVFSWVSAFVSQAAPLKRRLELLRKHSLYFLLVVMSVGQWGESYKMGVCVTLCHWKNFVYFEVELRGGKCKPLHIQVGFSFSHSTVYYALQSILPSFTFEPHQVCTYVINYSCVCVQASLLNSSLGVYTYFSCSKVRSWNTTRHPCYNIYTFYFQFSRSIFSNILSLTVPASEFTIYMKEVPWVKYIQGAWLHSFINPLPPPFLFSASPLLSPSSSPPLPACNQQHLPDNHRYCLRQERLNPFPTVQEGSWSLEG